MRRKGMHMRAITVLAVVVLAGCSGETAISEEERAAVAGEAEAVVASMFEAMNAAEALEVLSHYTGGPLMRISCTQIQDRGQFTTATEWYYGRQDSLSFEYEITESRALGADAAIVAASGALPDVDGLFWTWVLEREDGVLRIVHEHESWADCPEARGSRFHEDGGGMGPVPEETPEG